MKNEETALTEEELKLLVNLQELKNAGMELSKECTDRLHDLESKAKEQTAQKALSHAHLNKLNRHKEKVSVVAGKLRHLDQEWLGFIKKMSDKIQYHAQMYELSRGELMEVYNQRLEDLRQYKAEMDAASRQLLEAEEEIEEPMDVQAIQAPFQALTQLVQEQQDRTIMVSDDELVPATTEMDVSTGAGEKPESHSRTKPVAFRNNAGSPTRVAVGHLKPKVNGSKDTKDKDKDHKESW